MTAFRRDVYTLSAGNAIFQWPEELLEEDCAELEEWLKLIMKKIKRFAPVPIIPTRQDK